MSTLPASPGGPITSAAIPQHLPIAAFFGDSANAHGVVTNLDLSGRDGLRAVMRITSEPDYRAEDLERAPFSLRHYYAHVVEMASEVGGEIFPRVRLVLVNPDGQTASFVSEGIVDSLDLIRRYEGNGPYDPALPVVVTRHKTRRGNTVLRLELATDAPTEQNPPHRGGRKG